jgi:hypothetical protein
MADYTSMSNAIRSVLYKKEKSATSMPELPDDEAIVDPDPVETAKTDSAILHPRMLVQRHVHTGKDNNVRRQLVRNIRSQFKQKIIDND